MSYFIPDLTGENPAFRVNNSKKRVHTADQVIEFFQPIYAATLEITIEGTITVPMIQGIDFTVKVSDRDDNAMGDAQLLSTKFDSLLIKSVTIIKPYADVPYTINCAYQQLYPDTIEYILQNPNQDIDITPETIWWMMQDIKNLKLATSPIADVHAAAERKPMLLPPDPEKIFPTNIIESEVWAIDTSAKKHVVYPLAGSFYRDSLVIYKGKTEFVSDHLKDPDKLMKEGIDYYITGADTFGIHHTSNKSGVYNLVVIISAYVGDVTITYHAYGGKPTIYDIRTVAESLTNVYQWVTSSQILTADTLGAAGLMIEYRARLKALEDQVRKLAKEGQPSYGDVTHGQCLIKKIASTDLDFHWWTIAELFQVAGSTTIFTADIAHFQIQSLYTKLMLDFTIAVNLDNVAKKLNVQTLASNIQQRFEPFVDDNGLDQVLRPQLRIIWNANSVEGSGIYLQFGLRLKGVAEEILAITDLSGPESCWKLVPKVAPAVLPEDDNITLPSGNHYWAKDNPDSYQETNLISFADNHICWAGSEALNRPNTGWKLIVLDHFMESEVDISKLKIVQLWLEETAASRFIVEMPLCGDNSQMTGVGAFTYANKGASVVFTAMRNALTREIAMTLNVEIAAGITATKLTLRYVFVNS